jgi:hypothetical protein
MDTLKRPQEWAADEGLLIINEDGWRKDGKDFEEPLTRDEYLQRLQTSTVVARATQKVVTQPTRSAEVVGNLATHYARQLKRISEKLRHLADQIEREGAPQDDAAFVRPLDRDLTFVRSAARVEHTLRWGFANLPVDSLLASALEVDHYILKGE